MAKIAINGGTQAVTDWIPNRWPIYDDREKEALIETLESGQGSMIRSNIREIL